VDFIPAKCCAADFGFPGRIRNNLWSRRFNHRSAGLVPLGKLARSNGVPDAQLHGTREFGSCLIGQLKWSLVAGKKILSFYAASGIDSHELGASDCASCHFVITVAVLLDKATTKDSIARKLAELENPDKPSPKPTRQAPSRIVAVLATNTFP
jgi:hypothetical protein